MSQKIRIGDVQCVVNLNERLNQTKGLQMTIKNEKYAFLVLLGVSLICLIGGVFTRCSSIQTIPVSQTPSPGVTVNPLPTAAPSPVAAVLPTPVKGWPKEYALFIHDTIPAGLLAYPPTSVCPGYSKMADKGWFWSSWFEAIASVESDFNRTVIFYESGISDKDSVTGLNNVSEGLLQVSYGDSECKGIFDFGSDKTSFLDDYAHAKLIPNQDYLSKHPEQIILNPYLNLKCGIAIANTLLAGHPERGFQTWLGKYWSSVGSGKVLAYFNEVYPGLCQ